MAHHEIKVTRDEDGVPIPDIPLPGIIREGDTVSYTSDQGDVTIEFELPFSDFKDVVRKGEIRLMPRAGNFICKCYLRDPAGKLIAGWSPLTPKAGGEHDVRPRTP
jgi:hypothetical protein